MYISKLTLTGFKSFFKKTEIVFDKGVTCIVGPNGCGKTNIVDAIRWVIGEQKSRILRANRNVDVIFNGSENRRAANFAEVSLTIHNVSGKMPIDYTDVLITRRVFRNSDSEYLINKTPCRLKDITDLFIDTGMGANAYSVIELKMVEDILSETPQERRQLFEEAAGINKYHRQRSSAKRKLEATQEDLVRVEDIIGEVKSKVRGLKRQLRRYEKYQSTTEKLVEAEVRLASRQVYDLQQESRPLQNELESKNNRIEEIDQNIKKIDRSLTKQKKDFDKVEKTLDEKTDRLEEIKNKRNQLQSDTRVMKEKRNNVDQDLTRLEKEIENLKQNIASAENRVRESKKDADKVKEDLDKKQKEYNKVTQEFEAIEKEHSRIKDKLETLQDSRYEIVTDISEITASQKNLKSNIKEREEELKEVRSKISQAEEEKSVLLDDKKDVIAKSEKLKNKIEDQQKELNSVKIKLKEVADKENKLMQEKRKLDSQLDQLNNKIEFYNKLIQNREGFKPAVKFVLDNIDQFPGIEGALSDLIYADQNYYKAIETYISDLAELLVAKDKKSALEVIDKLEKLDKGKVTLIPMDINTNGSIDNNIIDEAEPLAPHVKCSAEIEHIKNLIFSDVYVCENEEYDDLIKAGKFDQKVLVSKNGQILNNGFLTGGDDSDETLLVGRQDKLAQFEQEYDQVSFEQEDVVAEIDSLNSRKIQIKNKIKNLENNIEKDKKARTEKENKKSKFDNKLYRLKTDLENWKEKKVNLSVTLENFRNKLQSDTPGLKNLQEKKEKLDSKIEKTKKELETKENILNKKNKAQQNARIERVDLKNKLRNARENEKAAQSSIHKFKANIKMNRERIKKRKNKKQELARKIQSNTLQLEKTENKLNNFKNEVEKIRKEYKKLRQAIQSLNEKILKLRQSKEYLSEEIKKLELKLSEYQARQKELKTVLAKKYEREIIEIEDDDELPDVEKAEKKVNRLKRRLEKIGTVNMEVKEQYEEEAERLSFMEEQRDDLLESKDSLNEIIDEIDEVARQKFMTTFEQIKENFQSIFNIFFKGGEADLKLLEDDPLNSKIEIYARPGGKKLQSIRMLSAGEKTLTAIALIFGIYQVKPSPFCILDEVDAPLDDPNTRRFLEMIDSFSDNTQFIIVTHNKITMSAADNLYGVTMSEKGVSQIVSARMEKELKELI